MSKDQRVSHVWQVKNQSREEEMSRRSSNARATWRGTSKKRDLSNSGTPRACGGESAGRQCRAAAAAAGRLAGAAGGLGSRRLLLRLTCVLKGMLRGLPLPPSAAMGCGRAETTGRFPWLRPLWFRACVGVQQAGTKRTAAR